MKQSLKTLVFVSSWLILACACRSGGQGTSADTTSVQPGPQAATDTVAAAPPVAGADADWVITPGTSIGQTFLEESPDTLIAILGKPDYQDAAMGKAWLTWFGKKRDEHNNATELNVFVTYRDSSMTGKVVRQIRTTSSSFRLRDSLHVYASLPSISQSFPEIKFTGSYKEGKRSFRIYDALDQGVAFETVTANGQTLCTAILVHVPGVPLTAVYFPIHGQR